MSACRHHSLNAISELVAVHGQSQTGVPTNFICFTDGRHSRVEMCILAYNQLLDSYRSLLLERLATVFGISVEFVDAKLTQFIASGCLSCTIDRVSAVSEARIKSDLSIQV